MTSLTGPTKRTMHQSTGLPRHPSLVLALLCALSPGFAVPAAPARAQASQDPTVTTLTESPDCDCRIELTRVISLSDSLHPGLFAYIPLVMRDSRGNWYATSNTDGLKQVGVFDQDGRLKKVIGRLGEGPGEFTHVNHIVVGAGDTLYVYDHAQLRRSVFDPEHEFVRTERIPAFMRDMVPLPSGRMIVNSTIRTVDGVDWPLHLVGADGGVLQTFGNEAASSRPDDSFLELRAIAVDGEGVLWVAPRNNYELSTYSMAGTRPEPTNRRYRRQVDWFQPWTEPSRGAETPKPNVQQIAFGPEDPSLLWVLITVADAEWAPVPPQRSSKELIDSLYDGILEVIDVKSGSVLASRRFGPVLSLTSQGLIPALRIDGANKVWMDVFMPTLRGK